MKLQDICVNLKLAEELKEARYPQDGSLFYWVRVNNDDSKLWPKEYEDITENGQTVHVVDSYMIERGVVISAPTAEEILKELPRFIHHEIDGAREKLKITKSGVKELPYWVGYEVYEMAGKSLADSAAKMWLFLRRNELV